MTNDPIQETIQRTNRYWYVDGLAEMGTGTLLALYGLFVLVASRIPAGWAAALLNGIGQPLFFIGGTILMGVIVRRLKERVTYPRTGYVAYRRRPRRAARALVMGLVFGATFSILSIVLISSLRDNWIPAFVGLALGATQAWMAYSLGVRRFYLLAACTILMGLGLAFLTLPADMPLVVFFVGIGLCAILSGTWALLHYLRSTTPPEVP